MTAEKAVRDSEWLRRLAAEQNQGESLLALLPQGPGSGLNADLVDNLHADELLKRLEQLRALGSGSSNMHVHGNELHDPQFLSAGTSGDMTKAAYDTTGTDSKVDTALNAEKLNSHTEAEVQNHAVTDANLSAAGQDAISKRHSQNTDTDLDSTFEATFEKVANKNAANGYAGLSAGSKVAASQMAAGTVAITLTFSIAGALTTGQKTQRLLAPCAITLTKIRLVVDTAPTGANLIVDVHTGTGTGTTIFTTQGNRPTITDGNKTGVSVAPDVTSISEADEFSVYVDQIGSSVAGSDLSIELIGTQAVTFT